MKYRAAKIERRTGVERRHTDSLGSIHYERRTGVDRRFVSDRRTLRIQQKIKSAPKRNFLKFLIEKYTYKQPSPSNPTARKFVSVSEPDNLEFVDRTHTREKCRVAVMIEEPYTHKRHDASICNFSRSGMYLESQYAPQLGTGALIYINNYSSSAAPPENLKKYFTQVIWVKKISGMVVFNHYGIGVKFCDSLEEFVKLFWS